MKNAPPSSRLLLVLTLNLSIFLVQIVGSLLTGSLALLTDSVHNLTATIALGRSLWAIRLMGRRNDPERTFGYGRVEVLVALANGAGLLAVSGFVLYEAVGRFLQPRPIFGPGMLFVTLFGLVMNGLSVWLLHEEAHEDLNRRSAFLHLLSDFFSSFGVLIAAISILLFGWYWIDPLVSVIICLFFFKKAWGLVHESVHILLESVPGGLDLATVAAAIQTVKGVRAVHDLHLWSLSSQTAALSAHLVLGECEAREIQRIVAEVRRVLAERFDLLHVTLQPETEGCGEGVLWCSLHDEET
ncbi:MAG: cation transporter [Firmicutes bacterium]|nr:cation transporter [Bacillota bacterium]